MKRNKKKDDKGKSGWPTLFQAVVEVESEAVKKRKGAFGKLFGGTEDEKKSK